MTIDHPDRRPPGAPAVAPRGPGQPLVRLVAGLVVVAGCAVVGLGSFLPWLSSGTVIRNSYQVAAVLRRPPLVDAAVFDSMLLRVAVDVWPLLGPSLSVPVVLVALRYWTVCGVVALLVGGAAAAAAIACLVIVGGRSVLGVALVTSGPLAVAVGGLTALLGGLLCLWPLRNPTRIVRA